MAVPILDSQQGGRAASKKDEVFWTPSVRVFLQKKTSLDKLQLHEQAKPKNKVSIQHQPNAKHEDRQKL